METITCKSCGKLFNYITGERICPACKKKSEEKFVEVKKYVRENPNVDIADLARDMDVTVRQIHRWVREERLVFSDDSPIGIPCESCGMTIKTGRFCDKCKTELATGLSRASGADKKKEPEQKPRTSATNNRMRFLDN